MPLVLSPDFSPEVFTYSVAIQNETNMVNINATPEDGFLVEFPLGQQVTPLNGNIAIVTVSDADGRKESYYIQFVKGELPLAKLSGVMLSAGSVVGFSKDTTVYNNIVLPYGVQSVTAFPAGDQTGSYFTFPTTASVTLDASGKGTVTVGVIANGYRQNEYTFNFKRDTTGQESELGTAGIALSGGGALAELFDPQEEAIQTIIVPYDTAELTVIAVKKNWKDTVHFDGGSPSDSKIFTGNLHGVQFSITVNCGIEYTDRTYQFEIQKSAETAVVVSGLIFKIDDTPVTVYQRTAEDNGDNLPTEGFDFAYNLYNFNFEHIDAHGAVGAEIYAEAEPGAVITVLSGADSPVAAGNSVTIPVAALASSREQVQMHVSMAGKAPNTYTIYFKKTDPPAALLDGVTITGIAGAQPNIAGGAGGAFDMDVYATTQFVVAAAGVPGNYDYDVRYETSQGAAHSYLLAPNINGEYIKVYISGGGDYGESIYTFNFTVLPPLIPCINRLYLIESSAWQPGPGVLAYTENVAYSAGPTEVFLLCTIAPTVVSNLQYSLDYGTSWLQPERTASSTFLSENIFTVSPAQSVVMLLKVTAHDGAEVVYHITVTKAGDSTNHLNGITVTAPAGAVLQRPNGSTGFSGTVFNYTALLGAMVTGATVDVSWPAGNSVVTYTLGGDSGALTGSGNPFTASITIPLDSPQKSLTLAIHPQAGAAAANTYTVVFAHAPPIVFNAIDNESPLLNVQTFTAPYTGQYKIECWGAQGGSTTTGGIGGMGGYSYGTKTLAQNDVLYVYAGLKGKNGSVSSLGAGGWNGGGSGGDGLENTRVKGAGGGGASDVRTVSGAWNLNLGAPLLIVAGGGGGAGHAYSGGGGGGGNDVPNCNGGEGSSPGLVSPGATQESTDSSAGTAYSAGISYNQPNRGQTGRTATATGSIGEEGNGGGGGGYYGGLAKTDTGAYSNGGGGGGSGWVAGTFTNIGGARGVNAGDGRVQFTYLGP